jgi:hypothetical protein
LENTDTGSSFDMSCHMKNMVVNTIRTYLPVIKDTKQKINKTVEA